jgi:hypothetical protein
MVASETGHGVLRQLRCGGPWIPPQASCVSGIGKAQIALSHPLDTMRIHLHTTGNDVLGNVPFHLTRTTPPPQYKLSHSRPTF